MVIHGKCIFRGLPTFSRNSLLAILFFFNFAIKTSDNEDKNRTTL